MTRQDACIPYHWTTASRPSIPRRSKDSRRGLAWEWQRRNVRNGTPKTVIPERFILREIAAVIALRRCRPFTRIISTVDTHRFDIVDYDRQRRRADCIMFVEPDAKETTLIGLIGVEVSGQIPVSQAPSISVVEDERVLLVHHDASGTHRIQA